MIPKSDFYGSVADNLYVIYSLQFMRLPLKQINSYKGFEYFGIVNLVLKFNNLNYHIACVQ